MQVIVESDSGATELLQEIAQLEPGELRPYQLGLTLREAKALLQNLQQTIVEQQTAQFLAQQSKCSDCGKKRLRKGVPLPPGLIWWLTSLQVTGHSRTETP